MKDICSIVCWFLAHPRVSGLFNVGTGHERSFIDLAKATFKAVGVELNIEYIDIPKN